MYGALGHHVLTMPLTVVNDKLPGIKYIKQHKVLAAALQVDEAYWQQKLQLHSLGYATLTSVGGCCRCLLQGGATAIGKQRY